MKKIKMETIATLVIELLTLVVLMAEIVCFNNLACNTEGTVASDVETHFNTEFYELRTEMPQLDYAERHALKGELVREIGGHTVTSYVRIDWKNNTYSETFVSVD